MRERVSVISGKWLESHCRNRKIAILKFIRNLKGQCPGGASEHLM